MLHSFAVPTPSGRRRWNPDLLVRSSALPDPGTDRHHRLDSV